MPNSKDRTETRIMEKTIQRRTALEWLGAGCVLALESRTLLTYGVAGSTLPIKHGFPLRVVIPRLLGYKSAKFVYRVQLTDKPVHGYWVKAGYPYEGAVPAKRLRPGKY